MAQHHRLVFRGLSVCIILTALLASSLNGVIAEDDVPLESQCRPYVEKALKELETGDTTEGTASNEADDIDSENLVLESIEHDSAQDDGDTSTEAAEQNRSDIETDEENAQEEEPNESVEETEDKVSTEEADNDTKEETDETQETEDESQEQEHHADEDEEQHEDDQAENQGDETAEESAEVVETVEDSVEEQEQTEETSTEADTQEDEAQEGEVQEGEAEEDNTQEEAEEEGESVEDVASDAAESTEDKTEDNTAEESVEQEADANEEENQSAENSVEEATETAESIENDKESVEQTEDDSKDATEDEATQEESAEQSEQPSESAEEEGQAQQNDTEEEHDEAEHTDKSVEEEEAVEEKVEETEATAEDSVEEKAEDADQSKEEVDNKESSETKEEDEEETKEEQDEESEESHPEEDLLLGFDIPENLRDRSHIDELLHLDEDHAEKDRQLSKSADIILRELKRLYDNAIKPLETLYKYRDLSNRHFGDPEIFSKPLVLFMGPWSGGKSSILNYLTDNEFTPYSLRSGAEPSPAYFNILMHGEEPEILDGTQLAADWTFSGLQKFGQGLEERLRGLKLPSKLLEKVNMVEIPGILEVRKQVSRLFPFNDACQWFIDRADIIFLVYDPSKLDVGPETEAILDQLKGREYQTRIILNKADQVKPEELMRVQGALIWNISPLMSSAQPPVMYTTSLWSMPYESGAPVRLLQAQERELLKDLRGAVDKRIDNKIASARRFAVRVRNHAKMVDCYLTTYYNHKSLFSNKKLISNAIIERPQDYHIYEGLSTLTNISRYDLPDPDVYRDFFRLNPLYDFQQLSATCTYFRGCPINKLDVAIAYDLPELVGKYKKMVEKEEKANTHDKS
uniref:Putative endocytosis/signaling protein ehd1 n=1 Tax=Xenopsylla cheopis TaxID=163159 RepID=A0A6M2DW85_XENCH